MTHTQRKITNYINASIEEMNHTIEYANGLDDEREEKVSYARWSIDRTYNKAFGALLFAKCYLHEIDEDFYHELDTKLTDEYFRLFSNVRELIG